MPTKQLLLPVYFSHSYRAVDRPINRFFWKLLWKHGFTLTVDPQSESLSVPYLELMMKRSAAMVGVVTRRPDSAGYQCSPFMVFEQGLAVQAQRPWLTFVESGVSRQAFPDGDEVLYFSRQALPEILDAADAKIAHLRERSDASATVIGHGLGNVGVLTGQGDDLDGSRARAVLDGAGFTPVSIDISTTDARQLSVQFDRLDFIVIDDDAAESYPWLLPFSRGRFIPTIRLHRVTRAEPDPTDLPWETSSLLSNVATLSQMMVPYRTPGELESRLRFHISRMKEERTVFRTLGDGNRYLGSLGRGLGSVFISNAADANVLGRQLSNRLKRENIFHFHYRYQNDFELAGEWLEKLAGRVRSSQVFVQLITDSYWRSDFCIQEERVAKELAAAGKILILPYILENSTNSAIPKQGRDLRDIPERSRVTQMVKDIDGLLVKRSAMNVRAPRLDPDAPVDVAFLTVLPEEYGAFTNHVDTTVHVPGDDVPNMHSWRIFDVPTSDGAKVYRAVLGLTVRPGSDAGNLGITNTIQRFDPRAVLLVGIAGGLRDVALGDVVIADRIYGYEYGKVDNGFQPRSDWNLPTDTSLLAGAVTLSQHVPNWFDTIRSGAPSGPGTPQVVSGPVASGDKVIDDPSDSFFAAVVDQWPKLVAVEMEGIGAISAAANAREYRGRQISFGMIRGISDLPKPATEAGPGPDVSTQSRERDAWKNYAAESAAVFALSLVANAWPLSPRG